MNLGQNKEVEARIEQLTEMKASLEGKLSDATKRLEGEEQVAQELLKQKKNIEGACAELKKNQQVRVVFRCITLIYEVSRKRV